MKVDIAEVVMCNPELRINVQTDFEKINGVLDVPSPHVALAFKILNFWLFSVFIGWN